MELSRGARLEWKVMGRISGRGVVMPAWPSSGSSAADVKARLLLRGGVVCGREGDWYAGGSDFQSCAILGVLGRLENLAVELFLATPKLFQVKPGPDAYMTTELLVCQL